MANNEAIPLDNTTVLHVNMTNVSKLTASSFLMWSRQVRSLLNGYGLAGYLDGSTVAPPPTVTFNGAASVNPAHFQVNDLSKGPSYSKGELETSCTSGQ